MRLAALTSTSKRLSGRKAEEEKTKWSGEESPMTIEILEDPSRRRCHDNPLYQSSRATLPRFFLVPWILPFVCADVCATCARYVAHRKYARYTCNVTWKLVGARDIRGSQFIFPADSSKNLLRLVCRRSSGRSPDVSPP